MTHSFPRRRSSSLPPAGPREVSYRTLPATSALAIAASIRFDDTSWIEAAFAAVHAVLDGHGAAAAGPDGALYSDAFFTEGEGEVVAFVPVGVDSLAVDLTDASGRVRAIQLPATRVAVMVHEGPFEDLDQTYGALGTVLADLAIGADGPIREIYVAEDLAEVCWPLRGA